MSTATEILVRPMRPEDRDQIILLLAETQRWVPSELFDRFFAWKHAENPFGTSPAWVATVDDRLIGLRTYVCWEFERRDGRIARAVRAVDTATHPEFQGRGVFRRMTLDSIEELRAGGVDFVFNTPNEKSRPGYLKMGWQEVGRLSAAVRPSGGRAIGKMLRSRVPADRWSLVTGAGDPAARVLAEPGVHQLLEQLAPPRGLRTHRSVEYLRWRYSFEPLAYRALTVDDDATRGIAIFRIRRRGRADEVALCELLVRSGDTRAERELERSVARVSGADYVIRLGSSRAATRYVRLPGQGPVLTWRDVSGTVDPPSLDDWELQLGDVELF